MNLILDDHLMPLLGGALIGVAASLMLFLNGRVAGVSGIIFGAVSTPLKRDSLWRWFFIFGMILGGFILRLIKPTAFAGSLPTPTWTLFVAGLLVGFGTSLGRGCTSGHGVCGISRMSKRSIVATITFMISGILSVMIFRQIGIFP